MTHITWTYCQNNSDLILASGIHCLRKKTKTKLSKCSSIECGNYLISDIDNKYFYIGEAQNLATRIKQQSERNTSTFYKNYTEYFSKYVKGYSKISIDEFQIRYIQTRIGRKEMEEFGIENIPAILNKFQKEKREKYFGEIDEEIWVEVQSLSKSLLQQGERAVINTNEYKWFDAHVGSEPGIYWVEHKTKGLIYIGESSNILERYKTHSGTTYFSALRRHIGEIILGFNLKTIKGKKRYFTENEDTKVTNFLRNCSIKPYIVNFGRYELEDYLIGKFKPLLNRKGNK